MRYTRSRFGRGGVGLSIVSRASQRGILLVIAVFALVGLLGMAALTIDVGRLVTAAQRAQEVADATALAGAQCLPDTNSAFSQLNAVLAANNAATPWPAIEVDASSDISYYFPGDSVPDYGELSSDEYAITVNTHVRDTYTFARVLGRNEMHVVRAATAKATRSAQGLPCMFARSEFSGDNGIWITGSGKAFYGLVHSNTKVRISGSGHHFYGPLEYRNSLSVSGSGIVFDEDPLEGAIEDYPVDYKWEDYLPWENEISNIKISGSGGVTTVGHTHVTGDVKVSGSGITLTDGILLVDGEVKFSGSGNKLLNVTIIARGDIDFSGSGYEMTPNVDNLMFMSYSTSNRAINASGSGTNNEGTMFAPNGGIEYTGSGYTIRNGSLIGQTIKITGSGDTIYGTDAGGEVRTHVYLIR